MPAPINSYHRNDSVCLYEVPSSAASSTKKNDVNQSKVQASSEFVKVESENKSFAASSYHLGAGATSPKVVIEKY